MPPSGPPLPVEVREDATAPGGNLVAALATLVLARARRALAEGGEVEAACERLRGGGAAAAG